MASYLGTLGGANARSHVHICGESPTKYDLNEENKIKGEISFKIERNLAFYSISPINVFLTRVFQPAQYLRRLFSMGEKDIIAFQQVLLSHFLVFRNFFLETGGGKWGDVVHL